MARYTKMNPATFKHMVFDAGIVLDKDDFDPKTGVIDITKIRWATKGGNEFTATRELRDRGTDIDNCPENSKQLQQAQPWQAQVTGTAVTVTVKDVCELLAADIDPDDETHIIPRNNITVSDFNGKWIIANYSELNGEKKGGYMAILLNDTLSSEGFSVKLSKNGDAEFPYTLKAFYDLEDIDKVPFEIWLKSGEQEPENNEETKVVSQNTVATYEGDEEDEAI